MCKYLDIPRQVFSNLNPAIRPAVFDGHKLLPKGLNIHIPLTITTEMASNALIAIPDSLKKDKPERPQYYKVNSGDNLNSIASRLGVSLQELAYENNITRINRIRAGQVLRVPAQKTLEKPAPALAVVTPDPIPKKRPVEQPVIKEPEVVDSSIDAVVEIAQAEAQSIIPPDEVSSKKEASVVIPKITIQKTQLETIPPPPPPKPVEPISDSLKEIAMTPAVVETETEPAKKTRYSIQF